MDKYLALFVMVACTTAGQLLVKKGARALVFDRGIAALARSFFNAEILIAAGLVLIAPPFYFYALTGVDLRVAFSFTGLNYALVSLGGWLLFGEAAGLLHAAGVAAIAAGVVWFNL